MMVAPDLASYLVYSMDTGWIILQIVKETLHSINFIYISQLGSSSVPAELLSHNEVPIIIDSVEYGSYNGSYLHILFVDDFQSLL